jgi:hypothetical protein
MTETPTYEMKKDIEVTNFMQLIDLNGSKVNFQSEFIISLKNPSEKILVAIVNQEQLDNGDINFEPSENGKYARRITFQENEHQNHFIALKTINNSETPVKCLVVVKLKELPMIEREPEEVEQNLNPDISENVKKNLQEQLFNLKNDNEYNNMQYYEPQQPQMAPQQPQMGPQQPQMGPQQPQMVSQQPQMVPQQPQMGPQQPQMVPQQPQMAPQQPQKSSYNGYYIIGIICLVFFGLILLSKLLKKGGSVGENLSQGLGSSISKGMGGMGGMLNGGFSGSFFPRR